MKNKNFFFPNHPTVNTYLHQQCYLLLFAKDAQAPTLTCPLNQSLETNPGLPTAVVTWQIPSVADNSGVIPKVTCNPRSGSEFSIGQTLVVCEAVDESNNNSTCIFQVVTNGKLISNNLL